MKVLGQEWVAVRSEVRQGERTWRLGKMLRSREISGHVRGGGEWFRSAGEGTGHKGKDFQDLRRWSVCVCTCVEGRSWELEEPFPGRLERQWGLGVKGEANRSNLGLALMVKMLMGS